MKRPCLLLLVALLLSPAPVQAALDWADLFADAKEAYAAGRFDDCLAAVQLAYKAAPAERQANLALQGARCAAGKGDQAAFEKWKGLAGQALSSGEAQTLARGFGAAKVEAPRTAEAKKVEKKPVEKKPPAPPSRPGMVRVPAGEFFMGCNAEVDTECQDDEKPGRQVYLDEFWIDVHEVTVAEYGACVRAGRCSEPNTGGSCNWGQKGRDEHPVNCVDWNQAKAYCEKAGKRLPTEAEWEKAARGTDGRKFPWGNQAVSCDLAIWAGTNESGCGKSSTWPVCSKNAGNSPYGLCDMAGNVWEWVQDAYARYETNSNRNPLNNNGSVRVLRGGSWFFVFANFLRAGFRFRFDPSLRFNFLGFRCAAGGGPRN